ncbi:MAG: ABC transporter ATP-binding protein [Actinobacteria bacterium]|nr:ABC transporter ATP-binding protein [Actinomycetota bacterium]MCA1720449.1 ABC transporter ATP-binding protein [Actinomycetota bacterium]
MTGPAISLRGVVKTFGDRRAVDGLDLDIAPGTCVGLLGPNGAGKSTTMKMLTGQALANEGTIQVLGLDLPAHSKAARLRMGVVPQDDNLDEDLTVTQAVEVFAALYRVPRSERPAAVDKALRIATLSDRRGDSVKALSGGMRRRLLIGRALVHSPEVLLLDEPTVGLDPQVRSELWGLISRLRDDGVTILMSTHYIEEAERLADDVAVMANGRIVARGVPSELVTKHVGAEALEVHAPAAVLADIGARALAAGLPTRRAGAALAVLRAETFAPHDVGAAGEHVGLRRRPAVLEDVFVVLTGEEVA